MEIQIKPQTFKGHKEWDHKMMGVVLVEKESDIEPLFQLLLQQDDYWEGNENLIKVAPKEIDSLRDLSKLCAYTYKTDIRNLAALQSQIPFIIYQELPERD